MFFFVAYCFSSKYTSFSYIYNEEQFIAALKSDVIVVKTLPSELKEARRQKQFPIFKPTRSASPSYYTSEVLPALEKAKVVGLVISDGGCLQVWMCSYSCTHWRCWIVARGSKCYPCFWYIYLFFLWIKKLRLIVVELVVPYACLMRSGFQIFHGGSLK